MWCTPPSDGPDEASHYVRMVGLAQGDLFGEAVPADARINDSFDSTPVGTASARVNLESGTYTLPEAALPASACNQFNGSSPYRCPPTDHVGPLTEVRSFHARTLPTSYAVPATFSTLSSTAIGKSQWGRLGYLAQAVTLLTIGAAALKPLLGFRNHALTLVVLAITPLATYQIATLSPSGTEWAATVAFGCVLVRLLHDPRTGWLAMSAITAAAAGMSRDGGLLLVPLTVGIIVIGHREKALGYWRNTRGAAWLAGLLVALCAAAAAWRFGVQAPGGTPEISASTIGAFLRHIPSLALFSVGRMGWLVTSSGLVVSAIWLLVTVAIVWQAIAGSRRRVQVLAAAVCSWLLLNAILEAAMRPTGFGVQARYGLPLLSVGLIVTATVRPARAPSHKDEVRWFRRVALLSAGGHLVCMLTMIWRHTNGLWNKWPFADPAWTPPVGWILSSAFVALATAGLAALAFTASTAPQNAPA